MPMIVHLRWDEVTSDQRDAVARLVADAAGDPGCWSFTTADAGRAVRATAVWDGADSLRDFERGRLAGLSTSTGLARPQTVVFSVPDLFAVGYRPRAAAVPAPRPAPERTPAGAGL